MASPRVLLLAPLLNGGGVTTHLRTLARGLQEAGADVAIGTRGQVHDHALGPEAFRAQGVPCHLIPFPVPLALSGSRVALPRDALRTSRALVRLVRVFEPDVLHLHGRSLGVYARLVQAACRVPFVSTLHSLQLPAGPLYRLVSFWGARTICVSEEAAGFLRTAFGVPERQIRVIPHGVDTAHFRPPAPAERHAARARLGLDPGAPVVAFVGNVYQNKGVEVLMQALALLRQRGCAATLVVAGAGDVASVGRRAAEAGVAGQVRALGHTDTRQVLWAADTLVLPSYHEAFGLAVVEAMLCGVVPIRTPGGGSAAQIREGRTGFLVPVADAPALAARLHEVLTDAALRQRVGEAARTFAERHFRQERMTEAVLGVYDEVMA